MQPLPQLYSEFIPCFIRTLLDPDSMVRVSVLHGPNDMQNALLGREQAVARLLELQGTPNVYFSAAAFGQTGRFTKQDCTATRAFLVDIDYGTAGHRRAPYHDTIDAAWATLMTAPVVPAGCWATGHGLQAFYLLDQPYWFIGPGICQQDRIDQYEKVSRVLASMVMSDATFTPEHLFRVPLSVNHKPDSEAVQGSLLYWNPSVQHRFQDLHQFCDRYGVPAEPTGVNNDEQQDPAAYQDLPGDLRDDIEMTHLDRSGSMWTLVARMATQYPRALIHQAIRKGPDFRDKYGDRLAAEVSRCLDKIERSPQVYHDSRVPLDVTNVAQEVPLDDCPALSGEMIRMLARYAEVSEIQLSSRVLDAARFHEHLFATHESGVMETPCGSGKSTWALCHIALTASPSAQYLYVVDTLDGLYRAADVIERLAPGTKVGRYHAFNHDRCQALCGTSHTWKQTDPRSPRRVCRKCAASQQCPFHNRDSELQKSAVVMCHNGFIRLLEDEESEPLIQRARILVDEDLNGFLTAEFTLRDLSAVEQQVAPLSIKGFLPGTVLASDPALGILPGSPTFANLHYCYRDPAQTSALADTVVKLRRATRTSQQNPFRTTTADHEHTKQVLSEFLAVFRPGYRGDASYSYREIHDRKGTRYLVRRNRFNLGDQRPGHCLWILNASARLSPYPYPATLPVYQCPDLHASGARVSLHVVAGNPMRTKQPQYLETATKIIRDVCRGRDHKAVFVATDKGSEVPDDLIQAIRAQFGEQTKIITLERGRIRGSNQAGTCTFACLAGLSLFTSIDNIGATAALVTSRTIPVYPEIFTRRGSPAMPGGRFRIKIMREIYGLSALDELYQTLWRSAVRNDQPVEAIVVIPDAEWLSVLWRTVMPGFRVHAVHKPDAKGFKIDLAMDSFVYLMGVEPGREFEKQDIAKMLGYRGKNAWKENHHRIEYLLEPFFEEGATNRTLRRRGVLGSVQGDEPQVGA